MSKGLYYIFFLLYFLPFQRAFAVETIFVDANGSSPKILDPEVVPPEKSSCIINLKINEDSIIWTIEGLKSQSIFFVEKRINDNWRIICSVESEKKIQERYSIISNHNSGENQFRIKCILESGEFFLSDEARYISEKEPITFYPSRVYNKITLSREINFQVIDIEGTIIKEGKEKEILLNHLEPGLYYLFIEDRKEKFIKK